MILQALLLVTKHAEPIKGLLTAIHSFVQCCPFVHSPVPLYTLKRTVLKKGPKQSQELMWILQHFRGTPFKTAHSFYLHSIRQVNIILKKFILSKKKFGCPGMQNGDKNKVLFVCLSLSKPEYLASCHLILRICILHPKIPRLLHCRNRLWFFLKHFSHFLFQSAENQSHCAPILSGHRDSFWSDSVLTLRSCLLKQ